MEYKIEKLVWTTDDFEQMGWHDSKIYAIAFNDENFTFMLDIDYIFKWINPEKSQEYFKFWVSPATLIFENVWNLKIDLGGNLDMQIANMFRENPTMPKNAEYIKVSTEYDWKIELHQGEISFKSIGYKQYVREKPILQKSQQIGLANRGGISFS